MIELGAALLAGAVIGLVLGTLGAGGSILAVPVLVHLFGADAHAATTGSLLVVAVSAALASLAARGKRPIRFGPGLAFGLIAALGSVGGSVLAQGIDGDLLLIGVSLLMVAVALSMLRREPAHPGTGVLDQPIITFSPTFHCACPRAAKVLLTGAALGLLTGLFGVGGGFLVVPALVLALGLTIDEAIGTSLVVIAVTSTAALATRAGLGIDVDWGPVLALTAAAAVVATLAARRTAALPRRPLTLAFASALLALAVATGVPALASPR
ncbi:sulfite exporter TauE/SafE family protein [Nocardioides sp. Bht2]|uniref:sulfite exporter TauE/SafE family protein n=1 Tax=Nocardioides sp. Bht2 TaxID=3392297 RepID=UPI0039B4F905